MSLCWNQRGSHPLSDRSKHRLFGLGLRLALSVGLFCSTMVAASQAPLTGLAPLRWQQRIILVDGQQIPDAVERLRRAQEAIDERDILWFVSEQGRLLSNYPAGRARATLCDE